MKAMNLLFIILIIENYILCALRQNNPEELVYKEGKKLN